jgi:catechol 2,3-dioxygenase-like lactoylglutathione lyase family enzyme
MTQFIKVIPLMKCNDMDQSLDHYTRILDFEIDGRWESEGGASFSNLRRGDIYIQLSTHRGDGVAGNVAAIVVEGIDELFKKYVARGLNTTGKKESPVHQGPFDQTWGWREFYITDPSGNTLRFCQKL